jgi:hypothetical protein
MILLFTLDTINRSLKTDRSYAAIAANSMGSLTSLSFHLLLGLMPDTQINLSIKKALYIIALCEAMEKGILLSLANTFARLTEISEALK